MRFITTCSKEGFESYGHRLVESFHLAPEGATLTVYTEGFDIPDTPRVYQVPLDHISELTRFKRRHEDYRPPSWQWDVAKYANKVYAMWHGGMMINSGLVCWTDADCVFHQPMPSDLLRRMIGDAYLAYYGRAGLYTETGFWYVRADHHAHMTFLSSLVEIYESGKFTKLPQWHDCYVFDAVRRRMERDGMITSVNLSGDAAGTMHPMAVTEIGKYLDHRKGPRKAMDLSPENPAA